MSTVVMSACWPLKMPPTQKSVLISLADNANDEGFCWPSLETICERTCFGRTAVIEAIKWLEANGYLSANRANGRKTTYTLTVSDQSARRTGLQRREIAVDEHNQSGKRTGTADGPVREADQTSPPDGLNQSARRTLTVINRKEPSEEKPARATRKPGSSPISFASFVERCQSNGEKVISDYQPVIRYAEKAKIPDTFVNLCWQEFKDRYMSSSKRQIDWRQTFLNCVRGNWYELWYATADGEYVLSSKGVQASRVHKEAA